MNASLNAVLDELEDRGLLDSPAEVLVAFMEWAAARGTALYPHQEEAATEIAAGNHVIVATPTGSGKSLIGLAAHALALAAGQRSYYTAPLKALVSEKFFDLVAVFGARNVGMVTGDVALNAEAPIICCTAEILANQSLRAGHRLDVHTVVMDEFHYYGDPQRGWAWQVPLLELPHAQFVALSATLGDVSFFQTDLEYRTGKPVVLIANAPRPVPLEYEYVVEDVDKIIELAVKQGRWPAYVVHFTQAQAVARAEYLAKSVKEFDPELKAALAGFKFGRGFGQSLRSMLRAGVGVHHAGMLPRYRRLVEQLAQRGLLRIICGTDTLGVGINVPIRSVIFTQLAKFDGAHSRHLSVREFHQIAGRAGRAGFDTVGFVQVAAPPYEVENARNAARAANLKQRNFRKAGPKEGEPSWSEATFERLRDSQPEALVPRFACNHALVLQVLSGQVEYGTDAAAHLLWLAFNNHQALRAGYRGDSGRNPHLHQLGQIIESLFVGEVITAATPLFKELTDYVDHRHPLAAPKRAGHGGTQPPGDGTSGAEAGADMIQGLRLNRRPQQLSLTRELPDDFALNQPLSPFALAAFDLLDPGAPTFALDVISVIEATLENPRPVLYAQRNEERNRVIAQLKEQGLDFTARQDIVADITWPQPLAELLQPAFATFARTNPWVAGLSLEPKSVVRMMVEEALTFTSLISRFSLGRSEGVILRYLTDAYQALRQVVPAQYRTEQVEAISDWLGNLVRSIDSSLLDEWQALEAGRATGLGQHTDAAEVSETAFGIGADGRPDWELNPHALRNAIRNEVFAIVTDIGADNPDRLAQRGYPGWDYDRWAERLDALYGEYERIGIDNRARSAQFFNLETRPTPAQLAQAGVSSEGVLERFEAGELWLVTQVLDDEFGDHDWRLTVIVDVTATKRNTPPGGAEQTEAPTPPAVKPVLYPLDLAPLE